MKVSVGFRPDRRRRFDAERTRALAFITLAGFCAGLLGLQSFMAQGMPQAAPKEVRFKEIPIDINTGDRLVISGLRAKVLLIAQPGLAKQDPLSRTSPLASSPVLSSQESPLSAILGATKTLPGGATADAVQRFEALSFSIRRDGSLIMIETKGPESTADWLRWTGANEPELHLEVRTSGAVPTEVFIHSGQIIARNWSQDLTANMIDGDIKAFETAGTLKFQSQRGEISVESHKGRVEVDSFGAKVTANRVNGDLIVANFAGVSDFSAIKGATEVRANTGRVAIAKSSGSLDFDVVRAEVKIQDFEGPIRGHSDQAPVVAAIGGEAQVRIESNQGSVAVRLPASSGAAVHLQTDEGSLQTPSTLQMQQMQMQKSDQSSGQRAVGQMRGEGPKGQVSIKTKSGRIKVH